MVAIKDKLCLALDVSEIEEVKRIVGQLADYVGIFKVGKRLYTSKGPQVIEIIKDLDVKVFLDLKYHDIPNTVAEAGEEAVKLGVFMFNLHISGGSVMMKETVTAVNEMAERLKIDPPLVLGVTVLTSTDQEMMNIEMRVPGSIEDQVVHLAKLAQKAGLDGVVASPQEIKIIRDNCESDFKIVTPGVRPSWAAADDQKRIMTPRDAIEAGADYIVVGRPILKAEDPAGAAKRILSEIES